jgi:hypothetical protein
MRRTGVLMTTAADDPQGQAQIAAFLQGLHQLGWSDDRSTSVGLRAMPSAFADTQNWSRSRPTSS